MTGQIDGRCRRQRRIGSPNRNPDLPGFRRRRGRGQNCRRRPDQDSLVGCLVYVIKGRGRGAAPGTRLRRNGIPHDRDERISLNFDDQTVSRSGHTFLTYGARSRRVPYAGGNWTEPSCISRARTCPVLAPVTLEHGRVIILERDEVEDCGLSAARLRLARCSWSGSIPV